MCYIGVRSCVGLIGLDDYSGSSKYISEEDLKDCNKIILKRFNDRESAVEHEISLHEEFDVGVNKLFWNRAKQTSVGFDTSGREMSEQELETRSIAQVDRFKTHPHPMKGKDFSASHRKKLGAARAGKPQSDATKRLISIKAQGVNNSSFKPWWYSIDGVVTNVYDMTPSDKAVELGFKVNAFKDRFRTKYLGKPVTNGILKGMNFGRL